MKRTNIYLICLLSVFLGTILLISNAKNILNFPWPLLVSILLMAGPSIIIALNYDSSNFSRIQSLSIVFFPLIIMNYLLSIIMSHPVGFQDTHLHIIQYQQLFNDHGNIIFANIQQVSYNFVGIYIIFRTIIEIMNVDLINMVLLIPPIFNIITVLIVYIITNKLHSHRVALISALFFGWENQIIIFGHDMRTQSIGTLLLFVVLGLYVIHEKTVGKNLYSMKIALIISLFSIVLTSFVSIVYTTIIIIMIIVFTYMIQKLLKMPQKFTLITRGVACLYLIFFLTYLLYISSGFENLTSTLLSLLNETTKTENTIVYSGPPIYGLFATNINRIFWFSFLISSISYVVDILKKRNLQSCVLFISFGFLLFFWVFSFIVKPLSPSRIYIVGFFIMAIVVSFGICKMYSSRNCSRKWYVKFTYSFLAYMVIVLFIISSAVQFPNYVIGKTNPIRGEEPIDSVPYWNSDLPQYAMGSFLSSGTQNQYVYLYIFIKNYNLLQIYNSNNLSYRETKDVHEVLASCNNNDIVIIQDKFKGQVYTNRNLLPKTQEYDQVQKVYSNGDYVVYSLCGVCRKTI